VENAKVGVHLWRGGLHVGLEGMGAASWAVAVSAARPFKFPPLCALVLLIVCALLFLLIRYPAEATHAQI